MEALINNMIKALGWSIFHSIWQGAIIFAILYAFLNIFPKLNAKWKHNLAFSALVITFISFCFTFFSIFRIPSSEAAYPIVMAISEQGMSLSGSYFFLKAEAYFPILISIYLIGIAIQLLVISKGYIQLKTLKKASTSVVPNAWFAVFSQTLHQLKIRKTVQFFLSEKVNVPLVIGYFKPVVLFPIALVNQLDLNQVEAILIHELSHIRRNDYALNLIKTMIETILFFNPFIWLTSRFIHIEREHACDDLVLRHTGTPLTYAHALLKLEILKDKHTPALSLAASGESQHLYQRIKRITNMKTSYINAKQQLLILTLIACTVFSIAWINPTRTTNKSKKESSLTKIKAIATEAKSLEKRLIAVADTDSVKKAKRKYKIIISDDKGGEQVYTSMKDIPDSLRKVIVRSQFIGDSVSAIFRSKAWKNQMDQVLKNALTMEKQMQSAEWKAQMDKVRESALTMKKKMQSTEWKAQMEKMQKNALATAEKFNSKEWKDKVFKMQEDAKTVQKKLNSPEWKAQIEEMKKLKDSPEYQELKNKFDKDLKELKKKKGIKEDATPLFFDFNYNFNLDK